ncbi:MAG: GrpB family protein [Candidatus Moranbacteria bacterium]|nr:GrpB family protein [Candidatus Moranbacteria bacterium]
MENNSLFVSSKAHCEKGDYHIHISRIGTKRYERTLVFRDFLRKDHKEAEKYGKIKKEIFKKCERNRQLYKKLKNEYFDEISHIFRAP